MCIDYRWPMLMGRERSKDDNDDGGAHTCLCDSERRTIADATLCVTSISVFLVNDYFCYSYSLRFLFGFYFSICSLFFRSALHAVIDHAKWPCCNDLLTDSAISLNFSSALIDN